MALVVSSLSRTLLNFCAYNDDCLVYQKFSYISKRTNGIYEYDIKAIAGPLLVNCYLPTLCWDQADLDTPDLWLTTYPQYAFSTWEFMKISYLHKIGLCCIRTNRLTTAAYIHGHTQEIGDQCEISIFIDY
jgi:hypothetical protein